MAEPFGIVSGAIGIASAFSACIECFERIQFGRNFGRDFQTDLIVLDCSRLRFTRWGEAVRVYDDPKLGKADATDAELKTAKDTLVQILTLFARSADISTKYKMHAPDARDVLAFEVEDAEPIPLATHKKIDVIVKQRQKKASLLKLTSWSLHHRSELKELIEGVTTLIGNLELLFPPSAATCTALLRQEVSQIKDEAELKAVQEAATSVDEELKTAAVKILTGHSYKDIGVHERAKALLGNSTSDGFRGQQSNRDGSNFERIKVDGEGKVQMGDRLGGKDFFDD